MDAKTNPVQRVLAAACVPTRMGIQSHRRGAHWLLPVSMASSRSPGTRTLLMLGWLDVQT